MPFQNAVHDSTTTDAGLHPPLAFLQARPDAGMQEDDVRARQRRANEWNRERIRLRRLPARGGNRFLLPTSEPHLSEPQTTGPANNRRCYRPSVQHFASPLVLWTLPGSLCPPSSTFSSTSASFMTAATLFVAFSNDTPTRVGSYVEPQTCCQIPNGRLWWAAPRLRTSRQSTQARNSPRKAEIPLCPITPSPLPTQPVPKTSPTATTYNQCRSHEERAGVSEGNETEINTLPLRVRRASFDV